MGSEKMAVQLVHFERMKQTISEHKLEDAVET